MMGFEPGKHSVSNYQGGLRVKADVCIVGAGAGGCAAAAALAERGLTVAIVEEGRHWRPADFKQRSAFALKHLYQQRGARISMGNVFMPLPGGRGVGGGTLINSGICFRCPEKILTQWREGRGVDTLTQARFDAYFDRIWSTLGVTTQSLQVQRLNNLIFKQGAEALNLRGEFMARSAPGCAGCGVCQLGCPTGGKASVDRTFLVEALATGKVGVYSGCKVEEIGSQNGRVTSVTGSLLDPESQDKVGSFTLEADHYILSAGPIGTPTLLQRNGLSSSPHCGKHLVVHPTSSALAKFPFKIVPWRGVTQGYYVDCWDEGYLLQTYSVSPEQYFMILPGDEWAKRLQIMKDLAYLGSAGALIHDEDSIGSVSYGALGAKINYDLGEGDKRRLILGLRRTAEVFFAAGAEAVFPALRGTSEITSPKEINEKLPLDLPVSHLQAYAAHPMGTCRMGGHSDDSVVDPSGRVWGMDNLRVADSSLFPTSLGVNPQVTTMALGLMVGHELASAG